MFSVYKWEKTQKQSLEQPLEQLHYTLCSHEKATISIIYFQCPCHIIHLLPSCPVQQQFKSQRLSTQNLTLLRLSPLPLTPGLGLMCMLNWAFFHGHVATGEFQSQGNFFLICQLSEFAFFSWIHFKQCMFISFIYFSKCNSFLSQKNVKGRKIKQYFLLCCRLARFQVLGIRNTSWFILDGLSSSLGWQ